MAGVPLFASKTAWPEALTVAAAGLVATAALLWTLRRLGSGAGGPLDRVPKGLTLLLLAAALAAPVAVVVSQGQPLGYEAWKMLELALAAGVSEEIFFRGYAQSRLNEAFGRPWRLLGVPFGPGLLLASAFFGLIHAANPADYFLGVYQFAWPHALTTAAALYYGFLRERTGGVLAPAVVHAVTDIGARMMFVRVIS
jgi:membrane protease YdiL (CAAX protease family)